MYVFEILYRNVHGLNNEVVTAEDKEDAVSTLDEEVVKVVNRGPYLGEGPYEEVREQILSSDAERVLEESQSPNQAV